MTARLTGDRNQCPTCGEMFNSSSAFDFHRTGRFGGDRRCRTVEEMAAVDATKRANENGVAARNPVSTKRKAEPEPAPRALTSTRGVK